MQMQDTRLTQLLFPFRKKTERNHINPNQTARIEWNMQSDWIWRIEKCLMLRKRDLWLAISINYTLICIKLANKIAFYVNVTRFLSGFDRYKVAIFES